MGNSDYAALAAAALVVGLLSFLFAVAFYVVSAIFLSRIFEKAGVEGKWRAWVPVYNFMVFSKLGDVSPWWVLIAIGASILFAIIPFLGFLSSLLSIAALAVWAVAGWRVGMKAANKEWFWLLLWLIPGVGTIIWLGIIAFEKRPWNPNVGPIPWVSTVLADKTVWAGIPVQAGQPVGPAAAAPGYPQPGYGQPPAGYTQPPAGYAPPAAPDAAPQGYAAPPAGYTPPPSAPAAPPSAPAAPPAGYTPPPAAGDAPVDPPAPPTTEPPAAPEQPKP